MENYLQIDTPENVIFNYEIAGIGSRFIATLVDSTIIVLLQILVILVTFVVGTLSFDAFNLGEELYVWFAAILGLISFLLFWGYYIFFEMVWNGQSPGKRIIGLRVLRSDGTPVSFAGSTIRNLIRLIDFLPLYYGVGVVTMFIDRRSRRLGDMAAGTQVVHDRKSTDLRDLSQSIRLPHHVGSAPPPDLPVERLTDADVQILEEFLLRIRELHHGRTTAYYIARTLFKRMELPEKLLDEKPPETWLQTIYYALQRPEPERLTQSTPREARDAPVSGAVPPIDEG